MCVIIGLREDISFSLCLSTNERCFSFFGFLGFYVFR